jgi:tetratricopeptide (TPR) repeat protein
MNRHERRKNKGKGIEDNKFFEILAGAIEIHKARNYTEAEVIYNKLLITHPKSYELNRHMGILYQDTGRVEDSFNFFVTCVEKNPNGFEAYNNMGTSYIIVKEYELAVKCFNKSLSISDKYYPALNNLADLYARRGDGENSLKYAKVLLKIDPDSPNTISTYAKALVLNHNIEKAIDLMEGLVNEHPDNEEFQINLATAYREIGSFEKSKEIVDIGFKTLFKRRLNNEPVKNLIQFFAQYASDKKNLLNAQEEEFFSDRLNSTDLNVDQKITLARGFFEYFRNIKDFDKSYKYLEIMNELCFEIADFDLNKDKVLFEELAQHRSYPEIQMKESSVIPIFICGMPRSGTTLCEQILSAHSDVYGAGELRYLLQLTKLQDVINKPEINNIEKYVENIETKEALSIIRQEYLKLLASINKRGEKYVCDKMPHNFLLIDLIRFILPEAKIIYCKRKPADNCFSLLTQRFVEGRHLYCYNQKTLAEYYQFHENLMNVWLEKFRKDIFILDNEDLVNNQKNITIELLKFCSLDWEDSCIEFYKNKRQVRTASLEQVRQPINKKSIGAWESYKSHLGEMIGVLEKNDV